MQISISAPTGNPLAKFKSPQPRDKPNHFIALPVIDDIVTRTIGSIQTECFHHTEDDLSSFMVEKTNLHITLCALRIDNDNDLDTVCQCIYDQVSNLDGNLLKSLNVSGLESFWNRVLYAAVETDEVLTDFVTGLRRQLVKSSIRVFDDDDSFVPHVTILKFYQNSGVSFSVEKFIRNQNGRFNHIGEQSVEQVQLLSMEKDEEGHYKKAFDLSI